MNEGRRAQAQSAEVDGADKKHSPTGQEAPGTEVVVTLDLREALLLRALLNGMVISPRDGAFASVSDIASSLHGDHFPDLYPGDVDELDEACTTIHHKLTKAVRGGK